MLNVWITTNGMCAKNTNIYTWREQAIIEWPRRVNSIVACCHGAKLCAHAARDFRSQQNGAVTRMWRSCCAKPLQKERAIGAVRCKKEGMLLQPLRWRCVDVWFTTNGMCAKNNNIYVWPEQAIIEWSRRVNSIVACCHGTKLCAHAARALRSQHYKLFVQNRDPQNEHRRFLFCAVSKLNAWIYWWYSLLPRKACEWFRLLWSNDVL